MIERMLGIISKRSFTRLSYPELKAVARSKEQSYDIELINISSHGLRFKTSARFILDEKVWFDIQSKEEDPTLSLSIRGQIINDYTNTGDAVRDYGVRFYRLRYLNEIERIHKYVHTIKKELIQQTPYSKMQ